MVILIIGEKDDERGQRSAAWLAGEIVIPGPSKIARMN